jgi:protoheme IX farnesyltransferase
MPPVLGWAAATGEIHHDALLLFLIIFAWTPPHFWALALYRRDEYARAGLPMLPVTHGEAYTRLHLLLYSLLLFAVSMLPVGTGMSGWIYLVGAVVLGGRFILYGSRLYRQYSDPLAKETFRYSIWYLSLLYAVMLVDHYFKIPV